MHVDPRFAENPNGPSPSGCQERGDTSGFDGQRGRGGEIDLGWLIIGAPDENARYSSSFVLSEINIAPHSVPAQLTRTAKASEGPPR